jgi:hypothetical protein
MTSASHQRGPFPIQYAFVVQFANHTALEAEGLEGRIEHIVSGKSTQFQSLEVLLAFVQQMLGACRVSPSSRPERSGNHIFCSPTDT